MTASIAAVILARGTPVVAIFSGAVITLLLTFTSAFAERRRHHARVSSDPDSPVSLDD
jgi:hypothetical protein